MKKIIVAFLLAIVPVGLMAQEEDIYYTDLMDLQKIVNIYYEKEGVSNHKFAFLDEMSSFFGGFSLKAFLHSSEYKGEVSKEIIIIIKESDYNIGEALILGTEQLRKETKFGMFLMDLPTAKDFIDFMKKYPKELSKTANDDDNISDGVIYVRELGGFRFGYTKMDGGYGILSYFFIDGIYFYFDDDQIEDFQEMITQGIEILEGW
jgi:hypothetical protein